MLVAVLVLAVVSIAALTAAVIVGSGVIAWACIVLSAIGLLVLLIDVRRKHRRLDTGLGIKPAQPAERDHTAGDDLFGEDEVQRELVREERVVSPDMLGSKVPYEEVAEELRNASQGPTRHHGHRSAHHSEDASLPNPGREALP